jgi:PIN domain nuclease of toxin-antitoxin system
VLIDSNALLWFIAGNSKRINRALRGQIEAEATTVSVASLWEIAIKAGLGKLDAPDDLPTRVEEMGFYLLPVSADHAWQVRQLPLHHRDPFGRLLIAQAQVERLPIFTADPLFDAYDVMAIWS